MQAKMAYRQETKSSNRFFKSRMFSTAREYLLYMFIAILEEKKIISGLKFFISNLLIRIHRKVRIQNPKSMK
jgi:hypothetical protein